MSTAAWDQVVSAVNYFLPQPLAGKPAHKHAAVQTHSQAHSFQVVEIGMSPFVRLAGLSGALAISMGAYGSHVINEDASIDIKRKRAFEAGSRYHLIHSLALLAANKSRFPWLTAALFTGGILLFCGPCYHYSITGDGKLRKLTPNGGILFILGWLSFIL